MKNLKSLFILSLFVLISCNSDDNPGTDTRISAFLNNLVDQMQANSMNRNTIDWDDFRNQVLNKASDVQDINQADEALRLALQLLEEDSSFIIKEDGTFIAGFELNCDPTIISPVTVPDNIGYIKVEPDTGDASEEIAFAQDIHDDIKNQDNSNITGWIVDLRNNRGGYLWSMLAGIGPVLGEGTVGHYIDPDNETRAWSYSNGSAMIDQNPIVSVPNPYNLVNANPKVAVLLNSAVVTSGEALAIAFIGRNNTKSFGSSTCGITASNSTFSLIDGSELFLATTSMADRNKNIYGAIPVIPDTPTTDENIIQKAIEYINN
ncbi:S41 family peptidase [Aquimarina sp. AU474]|uniref:S41 family peptidase n=1 Tax=Aquimarina sp. AU474 TaxID=2108529 RepID=UPI001F36A317|nr:S41 family peptidase [Aquimarina sp. AU474]